MALIKGKGKEKKKRKGKRNKKEPFPLTDILRHHTFVPFIAKLLCVSQRLHLSPHPNQVFIPSSPRKLPSKSKPSRVPVPTLPNLLADLDISHHTHLGTLCSLGFQEITLRFSSTLLAAPSQSPLLVTQVPDFQTSGTTR